LSFQRKWHFVVTAAAWLPDLPRRQTENALASAGVLLFIAQRAPGERVAPDGSEIVPTSKPQPDGTLVKALARAHRWQRMLDEGVYASVSDIGDAGNISKSYVRCGNRAQAQPSAGGGCPSR
jgi:hypothetical protein